MSDITREKALELAKSSGSCVTIGGTLTVGTDMQDFANAVRADFIKELLGMDVEPIGAASYMPGTIGFTMVVFKADDVPVGANLLTTTQAVAMMLQEREKCAKWYSEAGWLLDEDDVPDAIRNRKD